MFGCFADPWFKILASWLLASGVVGFFAMWIDKARAAGRERRIPESAFFLLSFLGGFWGILAGEPAFRHKTLKLKFTLVVLSAAALWLLLLGRNGFYDCLLSFV